MLLFASIAVTQTSLGVAGYVLGVLWAVWAVMVVWAGVKLVTDNAWVLFPKSLGESTAEAVLTLLFGITHSWLDLIFWVPVTAFFITFFSLAFGRG